MRERVSPYGCNDGSIQFLPAADIDFTKLHSLLSHAFAHNHGSAPTIPSASELASKYQTPHGTSYLALREERGEYVAANGALHMLLRGPNGSSEAWMSCDTATRTSHRGQGLFSGCINSIRSNLPTDSVFFGFPNLASIKGFEKIGWRTKCVLPIWAAWTGVGQSARPTPAQCSQSPPQNFTVPHLRIEKTNSYLNWRYPSNSPVYSRLSGTVQGEEYLLITRQLPLSGVCTTLVLEHLYTTPSGFTSGLRAARQLARHQGSTLLVTSPKASETSQLMRAGFIKIPSRMNPRPIRLMGQGLGKASEKLWCDSWLVSLGDRDAL